MRRGQRSFRAAGLTSDRIHFTADREPHKHRCLPFHPCTAHQLFQLCILSTLQLQQQLMTNGWRTGHSNIWKVEVQVRTCTFTWTGTLIWTHVSRWSQTWSIITTQAPRHTHTHVFGAWFKGRLVLYQPICFSSNVIKIYLSFKRAEVPTRLQTD